MEELIGQLFWVVLVIGLGYFIYYKIKFDLVNSDVFFEDIKRTAIRKSRKIINKHKKQLAIQREKSVYTDSYGKEITTKWFDVEMLHFYEHHISPSLNQDELNNQHLFIGELQNIIDDVAIKNKEVEIDYNSRMTGLQFELFCKKKLTKEGWIVTKTKGGADQGVDLIIQKGKRKIGVQCKKYARPIGNKAVQEIKAGIDFYKLPEGIVLANNTYTKSAIELAKATDIKLFHYLETKNI